MQNDWLNRTEYPFTSSYMMVNQQKLHYIDEGTGETILFVHGTPSWSFDFRNVIKELSPNFRCVAVDHMGFGLSDKPKVYDYSTTNHSLVLEKFITGLDLRQITLVVHDFGGPIGLSYAIRDSFRVKRIIILNSWLWSSELDPDFIRFRRILKSPLLPFLYRWFNFSPRFVLPSSFGEQKLPRRLLAQYTRPFNGPAQRSGPIAFARSLLNDQAWFESLWNQRQSISDKPTSIIWGIKDPVLRPAYLEKFQMGFTNSTTVRLETCGHFPQEEQPERVSRAILEFLSSV